MLLTEDDWHGPTRRRCPLSGLVASWINLNLAQILHRLPPEFLKAFRQTVREFAPNESAIVRFE